MSATTILILAVVTLLVGLVVLFRKRPDKANEIIDKGQLEVRGLRDIIRDKLRRNPPGDQNPK